MATITQKQTINFENCSIQTAAAGNITLLGIEKELLCSSSWLSGVKMCVASEKWGSLQTNADGCLLWLNSLILSLILCTVEERLKRDEGGEDVSELLSAQASDESERRKSIQITDVLILLLIFLIGALLGVRPGNLSCHTSASIDANSVPLGKLLSVCCFSRVWIKFMAFGRAVRDGGTINLKFSQKSKQKLTSNTLFSSFIIHCGHIRLSKVNIRLFIIHPSVHSSKY